MLLTTISSQAKVVYSKRSDLFHPTERLVRNLRSLYEWLERYQLFDILNAAVSNLFIPQTVAKRHIIHTKCKKINIG